jgi:thiol:disulfide interchange protein DsbD
MLRQIRLTFLFLSLLGALALAAMVPLRAAQAAVKTENATVELVADRAAVPGGTVTLALRLVAKPGWHTYWQNPGDTGLPTTIAWTLPEGVTAGPIQWPFPSALPVGPFVNYGYEGEVWLLTEITVPPGFAGATLALKARADWLICEQICVPEGADLDLAVPVLAPGTAAEPDSRVALGFERSRAALPLPLAAPVIASRAGDRLELLLPGDLKVTSARFFPFADDVVIAAEPQPFADGRLEVAIEKTFKGDRLAGIIVVESDGWRRAYIVDQALSVATGAALAAEPAAAIGLPLALLFAFLGGIILNLMPCVLPVLSIKAMAFAGRDNPAAVRADGLAYTAGVLVCFGVLAALLISLRAGGELVGWGFQLQSPLVVGLLTYLFFVLGLWMLDVVALGGGIAGLGDGLARRGGIAGSFGTGLLAAVVATPCTAPFMGAALGFALVQPPAAALAIFISLGLGMALPFLILSFVPALARRLPKPGLWMVRLKKLLAFPLFGSAVWLLWVLSVQAGPMAVATAGAGLVLLAFGAFMAREFAGHGGRLTALAAVIVAIGLAALPSPRSGGDGLAAQAGAEAYSPERLAELRAQGRAVFVNLTAAWCITCLVNEQVALDRPAVTRALSDGKITYLLGDWTNRDPAITRLLTEHGRSGVPLYLFYPQGGGAPRVLPQLLTEGLVLEALAQP